LLERVVAVARPPDRATESPVLMPDETPVKRPTTILRRARYDPKTWEAIVDRHPEADVYQGPDWLAFLQATQGAEPIIARVQQDGVDVGYFVGAVVRRFGFRILGSPLHGWNTQAMGFLLDDRADRRAAAEALLDFAFRTLGCIHVELADRRLDATTMSGSSYAAETGTTFRIDLTSPEEDLFAGLRTTNRRRVRQATRAGLWIDADPALEFADEYYALMRTVFARQGLAPTYPIGRIREMLRAVTPTGRLLPLRVRTADGETVAASISIGRGNMAVLVGIASDRDDPRFHPIDLLWWEMIVRWKAAGMRVFDMGGGGEYKQRYGGQRTPVTHFYRPRWALLGLGRVAVRRLVRVRQVLAAGLRPGARTRAGERVAEASDDDG
jgi:CelD/BcsL family acetyltransferase involved in cellulose biosynthesis